MCLARSIFANLCPIMIHLNDLDFNVCRFEEVISFFWRSVYLWECTTFAPATIAPMINANVNITQILILILTLRRTKNPIMTLTLTLCCHRYRHRSNSCRWSKCRIIISDADIHWKHWRRELTQYGCMMHELLGNTANIDTCSSQACQRENIDTKHVNNVDTCIMKARAVMFVCKNIND